MGQLAVGAFVVIVLLTTFGAMGATIVDAARKQKWLNVLTAVVFLGVAVLASLNIHPLFAAAGLFLAYAVGREIWLIQDKEEQHDIEQPR